MCFEFEALYWAKLAEEEDKRKEAEKRKAADTRPQPPLVHDKDPLPA